MKPALSAVLGALTALLALVLAGCATPPPNALPAEVIQHALVATYGNTEPCFMDTLGNIPIKLIHGTIIAPAAVNGVPTIGVIDTGAEQTLITPDLAAAAKITSTATTQARGVTGAFSLGQGNAAAIVAGDLLLTHAPHIGIYPFVRSHGTLLGINIGADFLRGLEYDIDFAHETIRVYRLGACRRLDPPWPDTAQRLGLALRVRSGGSQPCGIFCQLMRGPQVALPVRLADKRTLAVFDTGSAASLVSYDTAMQSGVTRAALDADPPQVITGISGTRETVKLHRFARLAVGPAVLNDVILRVRMQRDPLDPPMIMGMDIISRFHVWLSYRTLSMFLDTGTPRPPVPPLDRPHMVGATTLPAYPLNGNGQSADMDVMCWVEADGSLTGCAVSNNTAGANFAAKALEWLAGPSHPFVQPAYRNGQPIRQYHGWHVHLAP